MYIRVLETFPKQYVLIPKSHLVNRGDTVAHYEWYMSSSRKKTTKQFVKKGAVKKLIHNIEGSDK